jgi:hypothetical protein
MPKFREWLSLGVDSVERAAYSNTGPVEHMRVNHRRGHILVTKQLLDRADVIPALQQMGSQKMHLNFSRVGSKFCRLV